MRNNARVSSFYGDKFLISYEISTAKPLESKQWICCGANASPALSPGLEDVFPFTRTVIWPASPQDMIT